MKIEKQQKIPRTSSKKLATLEVEAATSTAKLSTNLDIKSEFGSIDDFREYSTNLKSENSVKDFVEFSANKNLIINPENVRNLQLKEMLIPKLKRTHLLKVGLQNTQNLFSERANFSIENPHLQMMDELKKNLKEAKLPTVSDLNESIRVIDHNFDHAKVVLNALMAPVGFSKSSNIEYYNVNSSVPVPLAEKIEALEKNQLNLKSTIFLLQEKMLYNYDLLSREVEAFSNDSTIDRQKKGLHSKNDLRYLNFSWGMTPAKHIYAIIAHITKDKEAIESPLAQQISAVLKKYQSHFKWQSRQELLESPQAFLVLAQLLKKSMQKDAFKNRLLRAKETVNKSLQQAEELNILTFVSSGNSGESAHFYKDNFFGANIFSDLEPILSIGASSLNDPSNLDDDSTADFSSPNADFLVNGTHFPSELSVEGDDGTTMASPFALSIATLMNSAYSEENPGKSLSAKDIRRIFSHEFILEDLEGSFDGKGQLDIVAAVELARDWDDFKI